MLPIDLKTYQTIENNSSDGVCALSQAQLSNAAGISRRTLNYSLTRLKAAGFISAEPRRAGGQFAATVHRVQFVHKSNIKTKRKTKPISNKGVLIDSIRNSGYAYKLEFINTVPKELRKKIGYPAYSYAYYEFKESFTKETPKKRVVCGRLGSKLRCFAIQKKIKVAAQKLQLATINTIKPPQSLNNRREAEVLHSDKDLNTTTLHSGATNQGGREPPGREPPILHIPADNFTSQWGDLQYGTKRAA